MEFQDQRPTTARPGTATSSNGISSTRPLSAIPSPYFPPAAQAIPRDPFQAQPIEAGGLSRNPRSMQQSPMSGDAFAGQSRAASHQMPPPQSIINRESALSEVPSTSHPTIAGVSSTLNSFASGNREERSLQQISPSSSTVALEESLQRKFPEQRSRTMPANIPHTSSSSTLRALSASPLIFPPTLEHEIPPRRELPFSRGSSRSDTSRPASASKSRDGCRPSTASPLKRSFVPDIDENARPKFTRETEKTNASLSTATARPTSSHSIKTAPRKQSRIDELLSNNKVLGSRDPNANIVRGSSSVDAPHESVLPPPSSPLVRSSSNRNQTDNDCTIRAYAAAPSDGQDDQRISLEYYAAHSREDRDAAMERFMMEKLNDPAFTRLCEDVENCWQRIALGL